MDKEELIEYLKENLKIRIDYFGRTSISISLSLENVGEISSFEHDVPDFSRDSDWLD